MNHLSFFITIHECAINKTVIISEKYIVFKRTPQTSTKLSANRILKPASHVVWSERNGEPMLPDVHRLLSHFSL